MIRSELVEKASDQGGGDSGPVGEGNGISSADGSAGRTSWAGEGSVIGGENGGAGGSKGAGGGILSSAIVVACNGGVDAVS
jgi:hypothetical protein